MGLKHSFLNGLTKGGLWRSFVLKVFGTSRCFKTSCMRVPLRRELLSCSQSQELCQLANLAPDWLIKSERPIRSRLCSLTRLLTITTTQKFPSLFVGARLFGLLFALLVDSRLGVFASFQGFVLLIRVVSVSIKALKTFFIAIRKYRLNGFQDTKPLKFILVNLLEYRSNSFVFNTFPFSPG